MFDAPVDVDRLTKPEADAFRYIAQVLGARFAGDHTIGDEASLQTMLTGEVTPLPRPAKTDDVGASATRPAELQPPQRLKSGSSDSTTPRDPALIRALDSIPMPLLVADGDAVLFLNRTALGKFGHTSADIVNAAGGLGALFDRRAHRRGALVPMLTAAGESMLAKVTLGSVTWAGRRAVLITIDDQAAALDTAESAARMFQSDGVTSAALRAALEVCPHPAAIVTAEGDALAANNAYLKLEDGLFSVGAGPLVGQPAMHQLTHRALGSIDGTVQRVERIAIGEGLFEARAIALGPLPACAIALLPAQYAQRQDGNGTIAAPMLTAPAASNDALPLQRSIVDVVHKVRAIATDLAVLFVGEGDSARAQVPAPVGDALERLAQALSRQARPRTVVTLRQNGSAIRITGAGAAAQPLDECLALSLTDNADARAVRVLRHGEGDVSISLMEAQA